MSVEQVDLINPTPRDVQIGSIIDQCTDKKAEKVIARRRIDFVSGNVNSYARILNGPGQLEKIKSYNQLASSIASLQRERQENNEKAQTKKQLEDEAKKANKLERERKEKEEHERLVPICQAMVDEGLQYVMSLKLDQKREILKHVFKHPDAKKSLRLPRANRLLDELLSGPPEEDALLPHDDLVPPLPALDVIEKSIEADNTVESSGAEGIV